MKVEFAGLNWLVTERLNQSPGAVLAVTAYTEWVRNQHALRRGEPMPRSVLPWILAATVTGIAIIAGVVLLISALR